MTLRIVFDTNVLLSATLWDGSVAQKLLFGLIRQGATIYSSVEILAEYQKVLARDFEYSPGQISNTMTTVLRFLTLISAIGPVKIVHDDPDDDKIIECAIAGNAEAIITYDPHLLKLGKYRSILIIRPEEAHARYV
ncbi:MAG TPA: putative toxin-antitoxin system toxin component, PIN family [Candidatus Nanoarchaeia archaeon]|nr:putative toxin-antitoxin system toxin component, PIN family [Candidatus Nanoarchaeia archaeon]